MKTIVAALPGTLFGIAARRSGVVGVILLLVSDSQIASGANPKSVVLVPPFENQTKYHESISYEVGSGNRPDGPKRAYRVDRYTEAPRSLLEDGLGQIEGVTIVERQRVDALLQEAEFGRLSGLVDSEKAVRLGKLLGAHLVVMAAIVDLRDEQRNFRGYGIETRSTETLCSIRVRLLDIATGTVKFSKIVKGSKNLAESTYGGTASSDRHFAAIEDALQQLHDDAQFKRAVLGSSSAVAAGGEGEVEVEFAPKPDNCDIEINGKYVGGSPLKRRLPAGKEVKVAIRKGGYTDWEGTLVPEPGLRVTRELAPSR